MVPVWSWEGSAICVAHGGKVTKTAPTSFRLAFADEASGIPVHEQLAIMDKALDLSASEMRDNQAEERPESADAGRGGGRAQRAESEGQEGEGGDG